MPTASTFVERARPAENLGSRVKRDMRRKAVVSVCLAVYSLFGMGGGCASLHNLGWRYHIEGILSSRHRTEHLDLYSRPGSRGSANAETIGSMAERELARLCALLEVKNDTRYSLFLFENYGEMQALAKIEEKATAGFADRGAAYIAFDDESGLAHEVVHLISDAKLGEAANSFLSEGLASALPAPVSGVPVHAFAKYFRLQSKLPRLAELIGTSDLLKWDKMHPGLHSYNIAASWTKFLLETYGIAKLKQYYVGRPAKEVFGVEMDTLEAAWHAALDKYDLSFKEQSFVRSLCGGPMIVTRGGTLRLGVEGDQVGERRSWSKDGVRLNETAVTLALRDLTVADSGTYEVAVSNSAGVVTYTQKWVVMVIPARH